MCGIVGYIGPKEAAPILLSGLSKLEYRGYDSSGIAILSQEKIAMEKIKGRLAVLEEKTANGTLLKGQIGIGHTRWATHGAPSDVNSHPHMSQSGKFAIVHNGIIENYLPLKEELISKGYIFKSQTDTEVIAHLLDDCKTDDMLNTIIRVMDRINGSFALGILCTDEPDCFYAVRKDSPLIVGIGVGENFIASDIPAILEYTKNTYLLENNEIVKLTTDNVTIYNTNKEIVHKDVYKVNWDAKAAEKDGYPHFMLKEIMEQPRALADTINPRIRDGKIVLDDIKLTKEELLDINKIHIVACGSAYHVGVVAKYFLEEFTHIPTEAEVASEFRYRNPIIDQHTLVIIISQSGETADTLAALREAKKLGARVLSIVNVVGSSIARESTDVLYTWAGPEIAVATTKAYSTQLSAMYLIGIYIAQTLKTISEDKIQNLISALSSIPDCIKKVLDVHGQVKEIAKNHYTANDVFFLGRGIAYAAGLEGSLKLKEISYIHSEAYPAGELKHGTISLIEEGTLVVALATNEKLMEKTLSNMKEVKSRGAVILALTYEGNTEIAKEVDYVIYLPKTSRFFSASTAVVPLQLFGYEMALLRGCDIDKPRNLAKSVTVE